MTNKEKLELIRKVVTDTTGYDPKEKSREELTFMMSRRIYCVLAKRIFKITYAEIGAVINRNHSSVLYVVNSMENKFNYTDDYLVFLKNCSNAIEAADSSILTPTDEQIYKSPKLSGVKALLSAKNDEIKRLIQHVNKLTRRVRSAEVTSRATTDKFNQERIQLQVKLKENEAINASLNSRLEQIIILCQKKMEE